MNIFKLLTLLVVSASVMIGATFKVDTVHSNVGFKVKHLMISNVVGNFEKFSGEILYDEDTKQIQSIFGTIDVKSINTNNEKRDNHLRSGDFFAVDKYPEITFKSIQIGNDEVMGLFTMRGVSKIIKLELENNGTIIDPRGIKKLGFSLSGKINRKDFGVSYNRVLEAGGVAIGDTVKLVIDVEANKQ